MSEAIYDVLQSYAKQAYAKQLENLRLATRKIEDQNADIARLLVALDRLRTKNEALQADNAAKAEYINFGGRIGVYSHNKITKLEAELKAIHDKAKRGKAKQRKRQLKRKYGGDLSVATWEYSYTIVALYRQWQRLRTLNPPLAQALRERLDEWKEAHRVKTP